MNLAKKKEKEILSVYFVFGTRSIDGKRIGHECFYRHSISFECNKIDSLVKNNGQSAIKTNKQMKVLNKRENMNAIAKYTQITATETESKILTHSTQPTVHHCVVLATRSKENHSGRTCSNV